VAKGINVREERSLRVTFVTFETFAPSYAFEYYHPLALLSTFVLG
jgi:hypothetical protein